MKKKTKKANRITKQTQLKVKTGIKSGQFDCKSDADCSYWHQVCRSGVCRTPCDTRADCDPGDICYDNDYCIPIF